MRIYVEGIGLIAPGLPDWQAAAPVLAGTVPYLPAAVVVPASSLLPAAERRRAGVPVKLALAAGQEAFANAGRDPAATATVFTSSSGDGENLHRICEALAGAEREISPTRFHNSVHNAPAGYWSIATGSREPSTSLCGHDASFAAGLVDAFAQVVVDQVAVGLIACDHPYPEPLNEQRCIAACFGVALVLVPQATPRSVMALEVHIEAAAGVPTVMADPALEALRLGVPAARCLPLLAALAHGTAARVDLGYVGALQLRVLVTPC